MRKTLVVGNWKMNQSLSDITNFFNSVKESGFSDEAWIAPQALHLSKLIEVAPKNFKTGAQNCSYENTGAFTGEISPSSLKELGCEFVIIGHSERRAIFKETHDELNLKVKKALESHLKVIFCIGETLEERESGKIEAVLGEQLKKGLEGVNSSDVIIAYEPVWAIGTGVTATPAQAQETHEFVRSFLAKETALNAEATLILYGGSVKPDNAKELFSCADIDGGLVGGASLKAESFMGLYGK